MVVSSWENHLFLWAIYTMAMLVITRWYVHLYHVQIVTPQERNMAQGLQQGENDHVRLQLIQLTQQIA